MRKYSYAREFEKLLETPVEENVEYTKRQNLLNKYATILDRIYNVISRTLPGGYVDFREPSIPFEATDDIEEDLMGSINHTENIIRQLMNPESIIKELEGVENE